MGRVAVRSGNGVELNVTAMLDMAFQLLAFFVLTFRPAPDEGQISLRLPPPQPIRGTSEGPRPPIETQWRQGVETLLLGIGQSPGGAIDYAVGQTRLASLAALESRLKQAFADPRQPFRQVVLEVEGAVAYEQVLLVVERCTRQKLPDGSPLAKLSLVERTR
jgi:biopolymer transport protein ExbD